MRDQLLMGYGIVVMSLVGLFRHRWVLTNTRKGQRLVRQCGESAARRLFCVLCLIGIGFGGLLAAGIVRPLTW